jgi:hypothetical protein
MGYGQLAHAANVVGDGLPVDVYDAAPPQSFGLSDSIRNRP